MIYINTNIVHIRKQLALSLDQFSAILEISRPSLRAYELEKSTPNVNTLVKLSHIFGITIDTLVLTDLTDVKLKAADVQKRTFQMLLDTYYNSNISYSQP